MKVVLTLLVRDEEDIIGENLEFHLSRGVDFVIAMDNLSDDGTPRILKEYERRGRLLYLHQAEDNFDQARWVTRMARLACTDYHADWVLNGDADEFWWSAEGDLKQTIRRVPRSAEALIVERLNFLPRPCDKTNFADAMIYREAQSRNTLGAPLPPKLCHRAFADIEVHHGNHKASRSGKLLNAIAAPITILHFPVRSYRQLRNKIEKGGVAYGRNRETPAAVGATWRHLYRLHREGGLQAYFESLVLTDVALAEGLEKGAIVADDRLSRVLSALAAAPAEHDDRGGESGSDERRGVQPASGAVDQASAFRRGGGHCGVGPRAPMRPLRPAAYREAIDRAVGFLRETQLPHGEFKTMLGSKRTMSSATFDSSPFTTSFVLYALSCLPAGNADDLIEKAATFLRSEQEFGGVWRYWSKRQRKHFRLPPDLDDTACASFALRAAGFEPPRNIWAFEHARDGEGRFLTWLTPLGNAAHPVKLGFLRLISAVKERLARRRFAIDPAEDSRFKVAQIKLDDVDPVVNANATLYLGQGPLTAPAIDYLCKLVEAGVPKEFSIYYQDPLFLFHAIARAHRHGVQAFGRLKEPILRAVLDSADRESRFESPLFAAVAASVLLTFESQSPVLTAALDQVCETQDAAGGWPICAFYNVWGAQELTTAFCLEALSQALVPPGTASQLRS